MFASRAAVANPVSLAPWCKAQFGGRISPIVMLLASLPYTLLLTTRLFGANWVGVASCANVAAAGDSREDAFGFHPGLIWLKNVIQNGLIERGNSWPEAETSAHCSIGTTPPRVNQRLGGGLDRDPNSFGHVIQSAWRIVRDVDDASVHGTRKRKLKRSRNIALVREAECLSRVPLHHRNNRRDGCQMLVTITVNEGKPEDAPVQATFLKFLFCGDLAGRIGLFRMQLIFFKARARRVFPYTRHVLAMMKRDCGAYC